MNWSIVFIIYKDNGVFVFDEPHYRAAVNDLAASMKDVVSDLNTLIDRQSIILGNTSNSGPIGITGDTGPSSNTGNTGPTDNICPQCNCKHILSTRRQCSYQV